MTAVSTATDAELLNRAMAPYRAKGAIALREVLSVTYADGGLTAVGAFAIEESCYIDRTGHFNAVELVISFNQLTYATLAHAIRDNLVPLLDEWTLADYWERQLPNVLITRLDSRYRRPLDAAAYRGTLTLRDFAFRNRSRPVVGFSASMQFADGGTGDAFVDVDIAMTDPVGHV